MKREGIIQNKAPTVSVRNKSRSINLFLNCLFASYMACGWLCLHYVPLAGWVKDDLALKRVLTISASGILGARFVALTIIRNKIKVKKNERVSYDSQLAHFLSGTLGV